MQGSDLCVLFVFAIVYLGMILGGLPRLHLDRTGVAVTLLTLAIAAGWLARLHSA